MGTTCHTPLRRPKQLELEEFRTYTVYLENVPLSEEGSGFQLELKTGFITAELLNKTTECGVAVSNAKSPSLDGDTG